MSISGGYFRYSGIQRRKKGRRRIDEKKEEGSGGGGDLLVVTLMARVHLDEHETNPTTRSTQLNLTLIE